MSIGVSLETHLFILYFLPTPLAQDRHEAALVLVNAHLTPWQLLLTAVHIIGAGDDGKGTGLHMLLKVKGIMIMIISEDNLCIVTINTRSVEEC